MKIGTITADEITDSYSIYADSELAYSKFDDSPVKLYIAIDTEKTGDKYGRL